MAWRQIDPSELLSDPLPVLWWRDHGRLGQRTEARRFVATADDQADLCWPEYASALDADLRRESLVTSDGRGVVQFISLIIAFGRAHDAAFRLAADKSPTSEMRTILFNNEAGISDLVRWNLAYRFCTVVFATSVMATLHPEDPDCDLVSVTAVEQHAAAYANSATAISEGVPADMFLGLQALATAARASSLGWPVPPYRF